MDEALGLAVSVSQRRLPTAMPFAIAQDIWLSKIYLRCLSPVTSLTSAAIDAIILTAHSLITVQVTISHRHSAKKRGFEEVSDSGIKKHRTWKHVFITDEDYRARPLRRQALKGLPEGISIYSAVFDVGRSDITVEDLKAFEVSTSWHCTGLCSLEIPGICSRR
jgi:hypothetical protein